MRNIYREFQNLIPEPPLLVGTVEAINGEIGSIRLPGDEIISARGATGEMINQKVFVRNDLIEGIAPNLPIEIIEI